MKKSKKLKFFKKLHISILNHLYLFHVSAILVVLVIGYFFGAGLLENAHLSFIRFQGRNVVTLISKDNRGGTGFVIQGKSGKSYIMTNQHICKLANNGVLLAVYKNKKHVVRQLAEYTKNDLCVLTVPFGVTGGFKLASSVKLGERVFSLGHPLLEPITVTQGELSSYIVIRLQAGVNVDPEICMRDTYELIDLKDDLVALFLGIRNVCIRKLFSNSSTVNILPGNSGSPTVNIWGNVVSVVFAANESGVHSYHVPLQDIKLFLESL